MVPLQAGTKNIINAFSSAAIGGGSSNQVGNWSRFGGGYGAGGTIGGGQGNLVLQNNDTIAGGMGNSVVGGLTINQIVAGTISGGSSNTVSGGYGAIPGEPITSPPTMPSPPGTGPRR